jgi:hypothetical protein
MHLNEIGKIVEIEWVKSAEIRKEIVLGEFVIMPNHMHGIVWIVNPFDGVVGGNGIRPNDENSPLRNQSGNQNNPAFVSPSKTLGAMIRGFKSASTTQINQIRNTPHTPVFQRPTL